MANQLKSLKGQLLLDSGQLGGSFFQRTVVLICKHDAEGAFGLVLNRSLGRTVGELVVADLPAVLKQAPLFLGGPVQPGALSYIYSNSLVAGDEVMPNLALGHSLDELIELGDSPMPLMNMRLFAGYAGWSSGQLEGEMRRKSWLSFPASLELVFETPPDQLWQKILYRKGGWRNKLLAHMPEDLSRN